MRRHPSHACAAAIVATLAAFAVESAPRPRMDPLRPGVADGRPPSARELVDAREVVERRFREPLAHADTAAGANSATTALLDAAATEQDRAVKWLLLAEARRLAAAAGNAAAVDRSIVIADAAYDFDAIAEEHRTLREIPLRALDPGRATALARVAEGLAERAEVDARPDVAADSWALAIRGWQRAGDDDAARRAAARLGELERARLRGPR
ncbi:MAG: hypothetical protein ACKOZU_05975 [Planctomycetaceae bacterium]